MGGFPEYFLWGASTSAHQVEGGPDHQNQWIKWEEENASRLAMEASISQDYGNGIDTVPFQAWVKVAAEAKDPSNYISDWASDHFERYEEDLDSLKDLGLNSYRFSLEWARIEPHPGQFDHSAVEHYRQMTLSCIEKGITPFVTIWHWTNPLWFEKIGGWASERAVSAFRLYLQFIIKELPKGITTPLHWLVLNEPDVYAFMGFAPRALGGSKWPPQSDKFKQFRDVQTNLIEAHNLGYQTIKRARPKDQVGSAMALPAITKPAIWRPVSRIATLITQRRVWEFPRKTMPCQDFIGLNYYMRMAFRGLDPWAGQPADAERSDLGWELYPKGLYEVLKDLKKFRKPVFITEHGLADGEDRLREWYIRESLGWVLLAMEEGVDVRGYLHWSLLDNFEWDKGFWPRFGLLEVNRSTLERHPRPSAFVLKAIALGQEEVKLP